MLGEIRPKRGSKNAAYILLIENLAVILILFFSLIAIIHYKNIWILTTKTTFPDQIFLYITAYIIFLLLNFPKGFSLIQNLCLSIALFFMYLDFKITLIGDSEEILRLCITKTVRISELLADYIHHLLYVFNFDLNFVAPIIGLSTAFLSFYLFDKYLINNKNEIRIRKIIFGLLYLGSGIHLLFFKGNIEGTIISIPFIILYIFFILKYIHENTHKKYKSSIFYAAIFHAMATLIHGMNIFLLPSIFAAIFIKRILNKQFRKAASEAIISIIIMISIFTIVYFLIIQFDYSLSLGNVKGGGDNLRFVPISSSSMSVYTNFTMFSLAHYSEVGNIMLLIFPLIILYPFMKIDYIINKPINIGAKSSLFLQALSICYIGFIFLWNFDLHYPKDYDLMVSMGIVLLYNLTFFFMSYKKRLENFFKIYSMFLLSIIIINLTLIWELINSLIDKK